MTRMGVAYKFNDSAHTIEQFPYVRHRGIKREMFDATWSSFRNKIYKSTSE